LPRSLSYPDTAVHLAARSCLSIKVRSNSHTRTAESMKH